MPNACLVRNRISVSYRVNLRNYEKTYILVWTY
jgi:hypothetical protein